MATSASENQGIQRLLEAEEEAAKIVQQARVGELHAEMSLGCTRLMPVEHRWL